MKYVCEKCGHKKDAEDTPQCCGADMKKKNTAEKKDMHEHKEHSGCGCC